MLIAQTEATKEIIEAVTATTIPTEIVDTETPIASVVEESATPPAASTTTVEPSATATPTETLEPTKTIESTAISLDSSTAVAILSSSVYYEPDSNSLEKTFVGANETVELLGRSQFGEWLYIKTSSGAEGFVFGPRFEWAGDYNNLPIFAGVAVTPTLSSSICSPGQCSALTIEIYPLPGTRCEENGKYRTIFIKGNGGDTVYSYYWNGELVGSNIENEGIGFELFSSDGSSQIGIGRIVSGDGQVIEQELFVDEFNQCG